MSEDRATAVEPIREGIYRKLDDSGKGMLLGSRCAETGQVFWPAERFNPVTHKSGTMQPCELSGRGTLHAYTEISRGLPGFPSPYALASIDLEEGPTLLAQLTDWQDRQLVPGMPVELVIGTIKTAKDDSVVEGPLFRPLPAEGSDE